MHGKARVIRLEQIILEIGIVGKNMKKVNEEKQMKSMMVIEKIIDFMDMEFENKKKHLHHMKEITVMVNDVVLANILIRIKENLTKGNF